MHMQSVLEYYVVLFFITKKNILILFPNVQPILDTVFTAGQMVV